jgi:hypothetical protein
MIFSGIRLAQAGIFLLTVTQHRLRPCAKGAELLFSLFFTKPTCLQD